MAAETVGRGFMPYKPVVVYTLAHPLTGAVRYVGITSQKPVKRLQLHCSLARRAAHKTRVRSWVRGLLLRGLRPVMATLETVPVGGDWAAAERRWIAHYRAAGADLANLTDGGEGLSGYKMPEAQRLANAVRVRAARHTEESKAHMRIVAKARGISADNRAKLDEARRENIKRLTPEQRAARWGGRTHRIGTKHSPETKAKMRAARLANPTGAAGKPGAENHRARAVIVDGIQYATVQAAADALGLTQPAISQRLRRGRGAAYAD